jgi:type IV secretion system protein VirB4
MTMLSVIVEELGFGREQRRERPISIHVPYLRHVSDTVIGLESGAILSIVRLDGLFFQTEDQAEINMRAAVQNTMIRALGSSRYSVWSTVIRKEAKPTLGGSFSDAFCDLLNSRYMASLRDKRMFTNELYLTIVRSGMRGALGAAEAFSGLLDRSASAEVSQQKLFERINELEEVVGNIVRELQKYGARTLGITHLEGQPYSEPCAFFNTILTCGTSKEMRLPRMAIRSYVGTSRLHFSKRTMQVQGPTEMDHRYGAMLSIKEYPPFSGPGMLDGLLQMNHEFICTQSFTLADKPIAQERISRLQRQIRASDESGSTVETDIDFALNNLLNQEAVFGYHHFSLLCLSREPAGLDKAIAELGSCLTDMNINWLREDLNMEASFWAQLPGNHAYIARSCMLSSANSPVSRRCTILPRDGQVGCIGDCRSRFWRRHPKRPTGLTSTSVTSDISLSLAPPDPARLSL